MFQETLLESSSVPKKRRGWSMVAAFAVESVIVAILVLVPLIATGMLPTSFSAPPAIMIFPVPTVEASAKPSGGGSSGGSRSATQHDEVVSVLQGTKHIYIDHTSDSTDDPKVPPCDFCYGNGTHSGPNIGPGAGDGPGTEQPQPKRDKPVVVSHMDDGELINKVFPVYPSIAKITGVQGEVKLHAFISPEGRIESLTVVSGNPLLAPAAIDAVRQWRYRPYVLNGHPVEVETWIFVNFHRN